MHVDALATTIREIGASRGVIFSTKGFQSGARAQAIHDNIDLYAVRSLTEEEWGLPGKLIDFYIQFIQPSIGNIKLHKTVAFLPPGAAVGPLNLNLVYGEEGPISSTPLLNAEEHDTLLETRLLKAAQKALSIFMSDAFTINRGMDSTMYMIGTVNLRAGPVRLNSFPGFLSEVPALG